MKTVAFLNQKGGVGKTSLCHHLGGAIADLGLRVLLVDYDPQASLTQGFLGSEDAGSVARDDSVWAIAAGREADPDAIAIALDERGLALVPGHRDLAEHNLACPYRDGMPQRGRLRAFLAEADQEMRFDYCLIDCPPNLQALASHALCAAGHAVVPTQPEDYGAQGLVPVLEFQREAKATDNPYLMVAGIILNQRKARAAIHSTYEGRLRKEYGPVVFAATVPDLVGYKEAIANRRPITRHDPRSNAAEAMRVLAAEFLERTGGDLP